MMSAIKKAFDVKGDDIVELSTKNESTTGKKGFYDEKWLDESEPKLLKQIEGEKKQV